MFPSTPLISPSPCSVLLVSSPTMPQLGTMLSPAASQTPPSSQAPARVVSHSGPAGLPQVRVVAQPGLPTVPQQSTGQTQTLPQMPAGPQIRAPASAPQTKVVPQVNRDSKPGPRHGLMSPVGRLGRDQGASRSSSFNVHSRVSMTNKLCFTWWESELPSS